MEFWNFSSVVSAGHQHQDTATSSDKCDKNKSNRKGRGLKYGNYTTISGTFWHYLALALPCTADSDQHLQLILEFDRQQWTEALHTLEGHWLRANIRASRRWRWGVLASVLRQSSVDDHYWWLLLKDLQGFAWALQSRHGRKMRQQTRE